MVVFWWGNGNGQSSNKETNPETATQDLQGNPQQLPSLKKETQSNIQPLASLKGNQINPNG
jgi:hypothetical protein